MRTKSSPSLLAVAIAHSAPLALLGIAAPATGAVPAAIPPSDFRLPPAPTPTATATPQVQGPVDTEGPVPVAPRVIPTAAPTPAPVAAPRQLPTILQPTPAARQTPDVRRFTPAARTTPGALVPGNTSQTSEGSTDSSLDLIPAAPMFDSLPAPTALPDFAESSGNNGSLQAGRGFDWLSSLGMWLALAVGLIAAIGGAIMVRSRRQTAPAGAAPIEPPLARRHPEPEPAQIPDPTPSPKAPAQAPVGAQSTNSISLAITPEKLSRSMMNATLSCAVNVHNSTGEPFRNLQISGDLVTAHGKVPIAEQLADNATVLAPLTTIDTIPAGEIGEAPTQVILPISHVRTIAQGKATLYVPLLRLRVAGDGLEPVTQTFVIGIKPPGGGKVQPFRLDEMPQTYRQIGSRALD